jgi:hypothetical protein
MGSSQELFESIDEYEESTNFVTNSKKNESLERRIFVKESMIIEQPNKEGSILTNINLASQLDEMSTNENDRYKMEHPDFFKAHPK